MAGSRPCHGVVERAEQAIQYGSHPEVTEFDEQASQLLGSR
jgi:hypothetical protein